MFYETENRDNCQNNLFAPGFIEKEKKLRYNQICYASYAMNEKSLEKFAFLMNLKLLPDTKSAAMRNVCYIGTSRNGM